MKVRLALVVAALVVAVPAIMLLTSSQAGATIEFSVTEHQTNTSFVINGQPTVNPPSVSFSSGDHILLRDDLIQGTTTVGFDNVDCEVMFNDNLMCTAYLSFTNVGDITALALLRGGASSMNGPAVFDAAVTGGTFAYRNAHGDAHAVGQPNGDNLVTFNLVTQ